MKRILTALLLLLSLHLTAEKMVLRPAPEWLSPKRHPFTSDLKAPLPREQAEASRSFEYNRLLVILVDFQEEVPDNPLTTGNGKFFLEEDPSYLYSIASPPHNREYFLANLEALRHYYLAVSSGSYDLQFDVYPQDGTAYTLPNEMIYYNPPGAGNQLFVSRIEEYFQSAFTIADQTDDIDFRSYEHYMIIHAGSDWQHDVFGDSPGDLPSFFIRVNDEEKAVSVNGGTHKIFHASNVPSTISQDFRTQSSGDMIYHSGYGALNAVMAHEFGHSLGLVDLYNVRTFQPMVGSFDIMDSGGNGSLLDGPLEDGSYVLVEGILPALPGAFSRALLFEDWFRQYGFMKDISEFNAGDTVSLAASSRRPVDNNVVPHIVRIPLSETEYVLLENRSVDPDGDGATAVFSTLDGRVILYPTPLDDPTNSPSYEYDYLLPSFVRVDGSSVGGGILAWHVNEDIIYNQGQTYADGEWVSNFDNNTVNTVYNHRGVKVIEADALPDLGNEYSWYWTGTPYEYFHRFRPNLSSNGSFISWSNQAWKPRLSSTTNPPLLDSKGLSSMYWLDDISNPLPIMTFKPRNSFFSRDQVINVDSVPVVATPMIRTSFSFGDELPIITSDGLILFSQASPDGVWQNLLGNFPLQYYYTPKPVIVADQNNDGYEELVISYDDRVSIVDFANDDFAQHPIEFPTDLSSQPLAWGNSLYVATAECLFKIDNYLVSSYNSSLGNIKAMAADTEHLYAVMSGSLIVLNAELQIVSTLNLPESFGVYEPAVFYDQVTQASIVFLISDSGSIYSITGNTIDKVFNNTSSEQLSQFGLINTAELSPILFFGRGSEVYAIKKDGSYLSGFPKSISPHKVEAFAHPKALILAEEEILYFPIEGRGYLAMGTDGSLMPNYSLFWDKLEKPDFWHWNESRNELVWYYSHKDSRLHTSTLSGITESPILWSGFRNGNQSLLSGTTAEPSTPGALFDAYVYPNPVKGNSFRLRLENFTQAGSVRIFDVSGALVYREDIQVNDNNQRDLSLRSDTFSSGIYILLVSSGNNTKTLRFAIEK